MQVSRHRDQRKRKHKENAESSPVGSAPMKKVRWDREGDEGRESPGDAEESETDADDEAQQLCTAVTCTG
jgi:hypothetical protein